MQSHHLNLPPIHPDEWLLLTGQDRQLDYHSNVARRIHLSIPTLLQPTVVIHFLQLSLNKVRIMYLQEAHIIQDRKGRNPLLVRKATNIPLLVHMILDILQVSS